MRPDDGPYLPYPVGAAPPFSAGWSIFLGVFLFATGHVRGGPGPSAIGGPFKLIDQDGKPITDQDMKGKPFLVFFGYTHCPDICPTTLFELSEVCTPWARTPTASTRCSSPSIPTATRRR